MASDPDLEEIYTSAEGVAPGWTFNKSVKKYYPSDSDLKITTNTCLKYDITILSGKLLENTKEFFCHRPLGQELSNNNSNNSILIKGTKIMERKGSSIVAHDTRHTVVGVNYKYFADMLIICTHQIENDTLILFKESLYNFLYEESQCFIPEGIMKTFRCAYIYEKFCSTGVMMAEITECITKFCYILHNSRISKTPITVLLWKPNELTTGPFESGQNRCIKESIGSSTATYVTGSQATERNNDQQRSLHRTSIPEKSLVSPGQEHKPLVYSSGICQAQYNHIDTQEEFLCPQVSTAGSGTIIHQGTLQVEEPTTYSRPQVKESRYITHLENIGWAKELKVMASENKTENLSYSCSPTVHPNLLVTAQKRVCGRRPSNMEASCSSGLNNQSCQNDDKAHLYPVYENVTISSDNVVHSKSIVELVSYDGISQHNQEHCNNQSCKNNELGSSEMQFSETHESAEKVIDVSKRSLGIKSMEFCNTKTGVINQHALPTKVEDLCNEQHVLGKQMTLETNLQISVTKSDKPVDNKDSKDIKKDLNKSVSIKERKKMNSEDFQETHGSNHKIIKRLANTQISAGKENLKSHLAENKKDDSTATQKKARAMKSDNNSPESLFTKVNTSNKTIEYCIINPVKSLKDSSGMERKYYNVSSSELKEKVIILLGSSGSGKTTLVNFIANYFQGSKTADDALVCVDANLSDVKPTMAITAYTFCTDEKDAPITVIDTPGLNDSSRKESDDNIQLIKTFLANSVSNNLEINAIGFVVKAHLVRLTSSERLIIDYVSSLFGQSVADHLITFVTDVDSQKTPAIVEAMKNSNIKSKAIFKFNNSALKNITQEKDELDRLYWRIGYKSWKKCFKLMLELPQLSVKAFKALQSKVYAEKVIESASKDLKGGLKNFINYCKDSKYKTTELLKKCEQVWELAAVFNHLKCIQDSGVSDVESTVVRFANEVCKESAFSSKECLELLFLGGSKGLLGAGVGVIRSIGPLYNLAKMFPESKENAKKVPSILYCSECREDHNIEREKNTSRKYYSSSERNGKIITYKCAQCECGSSFHKETYDRKSQASFYLSSEHLLHTTKTIIIEKILKEKSPECAISEDKFLHFVNIALDSKFQMFIEDLLKTKK